MSEKIRVLIVDDHKLVKDGIRSVFSSNDRIQVVGDLAEGETTVPFLRRKETDVVLMDINLPGMNGIDVTRRVVEEFDGAVRVVALSMYNEEAYIRRMLAAGAVGYVLKSADIHELMEAIECAYAGDNYYSSEVTSTMMARFVKGEQRRKGRKVPVASVDALTKREVCVLKLIAEELTNHEIAGRLSISSRTVDTHRRNLLQKLGLKNTAGLVKFALQNELVEY